MGETYNFRGSAQYHGEEPGGIQAAMVLELRALDLDVLDPKATYIGKGTPRGHSYTAVDAKARGI